MGLTRRTPAGWEIPLRLTIHEFGLETKKIPFLCIRASNILRYRLKGFDTFRTGQGAEKIPGMK
jgi:hypothetical protein